MCHLESMKSSGLMHNALKTLFLNEIHDLANDCAIIGHGNVFWSDSESGLRVLDPLRIV